MPFPHGNVLDTVNRHHKPDPKVESFFLNRFFLWDYCILIYPPYGNIMYIVLDTCIDILILDSSVSTLFFITSFQDLQSILDFQI